MPLNNPTIVNQLSPVTSFVSRSMVAVPSDITQPQAIVLSNSNRKGLILWNSSDGSVLIEFGAAPTPTSYAFKLEPGGSYELPPCGYVGDVRGLWLTSGGVGVFVREFS